MVVARVAGSSRTRVDGNDIEDRTGGEEGALEGLRLGRGGRELDAGEVFGSVSGPRIPCIRQEQRQSEQACKIVC